MPAQVFLPSSVPGALWPASAACGIMSGGLCPLLSICQVEVLERFQEQAGDSRQLNTAVSFHENCFSWLPSNTGRLPRENAFGFTNDLAIVSVSSGSSCH